MTAPHTTQHRLSIEGVSLRYGERHVVEDLSLRLPDGGITVIVGPNACGKSTLLRAMSRLLRPTAGRIVLDGADIHQLPTRKVAQVLGLLPQSPIAPEGIVVADLVARGRHPHQRAFTRWSRDDEEAVLEALEATGVADLAERSVDELSGGQRQRVWIAMALAQQTDLLLLDEPTTFLDITHQVEVLDLLADLNRSRGTTVAMVLHDLNLAARYADHLVAMREGRVVATGAPRDVVTPELVRDVFALESVVVADPITGTPLVVPCGRHHAAVPGLTAARTPVPVGGELR